MSIGGKYVEN